MLNIETTDETIKVDKKKVSKKKRKAFFRKVAWPYLLLAPALIIYSIFFIFPFLFSFYLSFMRWDLISEMEFVGLDNFISLFKDPVFWKSINNTFLYVLGTVPTTMIIALLLAVLVESLGRLSELYRFLIFIPVVTSTAITSVIWVQLLNGNNGIVNQLLAMIGITGPNWLSDPKWALWSIVIVGIWKTIGYNFVLYVAGLKGIDRQIYEAAAIDGAGKWKKLTLITFPLLSPINLFVLIISIIHSFQVFDTISVMTQGGPNNSTNVLVYQVYQEAFQFFDIGRASALSMILFLLVLIVAIAQIRLIESKKQY